MRSENNFFFNYLPNFLFTTYKYILKSLFIQINFPRVPNKGLLRPKTQKRVLYSVSTFQRYTLDETGASDDDEGFEGYT